MLSTLTEADISNGVKAIAEQIGQCNPDGKFVLVGVRSRGDEVAARILEQLSKMRDRGAHGYSRYLALQG